MVNSDLFVQSKNVRLSKLIDKWASTDTRFCVTPPFHTLIASALGVLINKPEIWQAKLQFIEGLVSGNV